MSSVAFSSLEVSENTLKGINDLGFTHMTEVQARWVPLLGLGLLLLDTGCCAIARGVGCSVAAGESGVLRWWCQ